MAKESEESLIKRAEIEERAYNWKEAAKLYEQVATSFLDNNLDEKAAITYRNLGYVYVRAANTAETAEEYIRLNNCAVKSYNKAANHFKLTGKRAEELECEAEALSTSGTIASSIIEAKKAFKSSFELFIESSENFSKDEHRKSIARTLSRAAETSWSLLFLCGDRKELEQISQKGVDIADKAWIISKEAGNLRALVASLIAKGWLKFGLEFWIGPSKMDEYTKEEAREYILKIEEGMKLIESSENKWLFGYGSFIIGVGYFHYGTRLPEDEFEQKEFIDKGFQTLENALVFARDINDKNLIIEVLFWLDYFAVLTRRFKYIQKRILNDIDSFLTLGKIYSNSCTIYRYYSYALPGFYYVSFAHRSFLTTAQRKSYAEKGIQYSKEALNNLGFMPFAAQSYQALTWSHSLLTVLTTSKEERSEHAHKMLEYAKKAETIAEKYEGGIARSAGYDSLYRAYKTLADIAENTEEKVKMLSTAIDASKKNIKHAVESRTTITRFQMRLGLLFEELGILSGETQHLLQAREIFLRIIRETLEWGYLYLTAVAYEYIARIEDRMSRHIASAESYKKAQEAHTESLNKIEYKLLKDRIKVKIEYTRAWSLIERAKASHKMEDHLNAKLNYEKACEILSNLSRFNYEGDYFSAWALLEEAEYLSKQETHEKAIDRYKLTKKSFENARKTLNLAYKHSKDKNEIERIGKLVKVVKVRINYCSARIDLERARILKKKGSHLEAAEKFACAATQFKDVCILYKIERERRELEAVYFLCKAWESMELAENYQEADKFAEAANLFIKASNLYVNSKLKLLASGNSAFCQALVHGCKFDESNEMQIKAKSYQMVKSMLRKASSSYEKGGFKNVADWALATSTYFDAVWSLVRADDELDLNKRKELLGIVFRYLKSAADLFGNAGYENKEKEVLERLDRVKKEEKIIVSALNTIREPTISRSTVGIVAPSCPIETSQSPRLSEIQQFTDEERRVLGERMAKKKYQLIYRDLFKEYPKVQKRECRVAIAQIGISNTGNIVGEFFKMKASGLLGLREEKIESIRSKVKKMIETACEKEVNILLFPEMMVDLNYTELLEDISNLAKLYGMYIIPGSYHDQETSRNLSMVIGPDGILWEQEKHIPAIIHLGKKRIKEAIDVSTQPRKTIVCNTEYGRIAIVICRDFLDMDLRVELKNFEPPVDIVLNPAFTPVTADFKAAHFDARRSIYAYCFFANVGEFGDSLIYTPEKERIERTVPPHQEDIIYKDVDLFKLRSERKKWEKERMKEKQFIQSTR